MSAAEYLCPLCKQPLFQTANSYQCENRHNFDIAKQGYVNLLPVQQKKSKNPGDNKLMIEARRRFLDQGYYDLLISPCIEFIKQYSSDEIKLLDIGCGEGYFTHKIFREIEYKQAYGLDISKEAIKVAARRNQTIHWMVASSKDIPLAHNSLTAILKINAPAKVEELTPYLADGGFVLSITPVEKHLDGLKKIIYSDAKYHAPESAPEKHIRINQMLIKDSLYLNNNQDIQDLFFMTPYAWNASQEIQDKIKQLHQLDTRIEFQINVWQRRQG